MAQSPWKGAGLGLSVGLLIGGLPTCNDAQVVTDRLSPNSHHQAIT